MITDNRPIVIYHGTDCNDGFCSAFILREFFAFVYNREIDAVPASYGRRNTKDIKDRDVFIVDFSYPREELESIYQDARSLVVLDHHKTARENLAGLEYCTFDMNKSGARLTWEFCNGLIFDICNRENNFSKKSKTDKILDDLFPLVRYVEDRDLWRWQLPYSSHVNAVLGVIPKRWEQWSVFARRVKKFGSLILKDYNDGILDTLYLEGSAIIRSKNKLIDSMLRNVYSPCQWNGKEIRIVNAPVYFSEIAGKIAGADGIGIAWYQTGDGMFKYSLRSSGNDQHSDVSKLAKMFGGGGHRNASGLLTSASPDLLVEKIMAIEGGF